MVTYVDGKSGTFSECATAYLDNGDDFQGARVTFDGGLILVRELDERLGLSELMDRQLSDSRRGKNIQLPLSGLLRQSNYSRLAGYERR
jgi:hypothetical protein